MAATVFGILRSNPKPPRPRWYFTETSFERAKWKVWPVFRSIFLPICTMVRDCNVLGSLFHVSLRQGIAVGREWKLPSCHVSLAWEPMIETPARLGESTHCPNPGPSGPGTSILSCEEEGLSTPLRKQRRRRKLPAGTGLIAPLSPFRP